MIYQSVDGAVLTITISNTAKANAMSAQMLGDLREAFRDASENQSLRGVLLTAEGDVGFSAGMDTVQFEHSDSTCAYETISLLGSVCEAVKDCDLPVATAMKGYVIGGALEIAASADFRVGSTTSWYSMPEVRIGIPSVLDAANLHRLMGWTKANELILTANRFTAEEMVRFGFLNDMVEADQVEARAFSYLDDCVESDRDVIAQQKRLFRTWKNTFERESIADSKKEFALAFARKND